MQRSCANKSDTLFHDLRDDADMSRETVEAGDD